MPIYVQDPVSKPLLVRRMTAKTVRDTDRAGQTALSCRGHSAGLVQRDLAKPDESANQVRQAAFCQRRITEKDFAFTVEWLVTGGDIKAVRTLNLNARYRIQLSTCAHTSLGRKAVARF